MDIGKSFTFAFDDPDWIKKLVIGGIVALIPIVNFAGMGYVAQLIKNTRDDITPTLPEWDEFGRFFADGLKIFVAMLVYYLPLILLTCVFTGATIAAEELINSSDAEGAIIFLSLCYQCLVFILAMVPYLFFPGIFVKFVETGEISPMLKIAEIVAYARNNMTNYVIVLLLSGAVMFFIAPLGLVLCVIGVVLTQWWSYLVFGHLTGQMMKESAV